MFTGPRSAALAASLACATAVWPAAALEGHPALAPTSLAAAAAAAGRPAECRGARAFGRGPSVWERARTPALEEYCDLVARAQAELATRPEAAKASADAAEQAMPGHAAPMVLRARALLALGMAPEALAAFEAARAIDARGVEDPAALHAYARALVRAGKRAEALAAYRALAPRAEFLGGEGRALALLEAADLSMTDAGARGAKASGGLNEAIAYAREARLRATNELAGDAALLLALTLDRAADASTASAHDAGAAAALGEAQRAGAHPHKLAFLAAPEDLVALEALAFEAADRAQAMKKWDEFLGGAGGRGPWAASARARLDVLRRGGAPARRPR